MRNLKKDHADAAAHNGVESGFGLSADDPLWKKAAPIKGQRRPPMGLPATYMGKPLTPTLRKKVEARQRRRESLRLKKLKLEK